MTTATTTPRNGVSPAPPISRLVRARDVALEHDHWANPRTMTGLEELKIRKLAASIRELGRVTDPLDVVRVKCADGAIIDLAIDGQRRTLAAMSLDKNMLIPVIDRFPEPVELTWELADKLMLEVLHNFSNREPLSDFELSEVAERMKNRSDSPKTLEQIGAAIDRSPSWVSRILTARASATPALLVKWKTGELTTEEFKDLAAVKEPTKQEQMATKVADLAKSGNKAEARATAKEGAIVAKNEAKEAKAEKSNGKPKVAPVVKGPQMDLIEEKSDKKPEPKAAPDVPKIKKPSPVVIEDLLRLATKKPPTAERVQGIIDGVKYAMGLMDPSEFGKAWNTWISRATGAVVKKPTPAKKSAAPKAKKPAAKKSAGKKSAKKSRK